MSIDKIEQKHNKMLTPKYWENFVNGGHFKIALDTSNRGFYRIGFKEFETSLYSPNVVFSSGIDLNSEKINDKKVYELIDTIGDKMRVGYCYSNSEIIYDLLKENDYDVYFFAGWLFPNAFYEFPIHHAWVVLKENNKLKVIDTAYRTNELEIYQNIDYSDQNWREKNAPLFIKAQEEARKHMSKYCTMGEIPLDTFIYYGSQDTPHNARVIYNRVIDKYPNHPSYVNKPKRGRSKLQEEVDKLGK